MAPVMLSSSGSAMFGRTCRVSSREPRHTEHVGGGHVVGAGHRRGERVCESGERRCAGEAEREHRPGGTDADHDRHEQRQDQPGEGDEHVDQTGECPRRTPAEHRRQQAERDAQRRRHGRDQHGVPEGRSRGDEHPGEHVAAEGVGSGEVLPAGPLQHRRRVDGRGGVAPDHVAEGGEEDEHDEPGQTGAAAGRTEQQAGARAEAPSQLERMIERGSAMARRMSTTRWMTSAIAPSNRLIASATG